MRDINVVFVTFQVNMLKDCLLYFCRSRPRKRTGNSRSLPPSLPPSLPRLPSEKKIVWLKAIFSWTILKSSGPSPRHSSRSSTFDDRLRWQSRRQIFVKADSANQSPQWTCKILSQLPRCPCFCREKELRKEKKKLPSRVWQLGTSAVPGVHTVCGQKAAV